MPKVRGACCFLVLMNTQSHNTSMPIKACEAEISAALYPSRFANFTKVESIPKLQAPAKTINIYLVIVSGCLDNK